MTLQEAALMYAARAAAFWVLSSLGITLFLCFADTPTAALSVGAIIAASGAAALLMRGRKVAETGPLEGPVWAATAPQARPPITQARHEVPHALLAAHRSCARFCAGLGVVLCFGSLMLQSM
ncbi:hypothetical protein HEQ62_07885 [Haematospirillum jordaniae]|nr:hypothetical protein [Haematospirillum jordaniae]NKD45351.1 hypothetical protein [Haematospirillum jordaniae]NKD57343.1 hypothetical protein [Haematospirillum jordaniae]NKD59697.1 hypothetical protein [Haematospirillum jordaniae]NKD67269.1 hypothetical protein [Haematospirillum jordaniae]NKD79144.1 hypothetical protein [Haematospirillum jordaniae]